MSMEKGDDLTAITEFEIALSKIYQEDPCLVLPNAIWKTKERLTVLQCSVETTLKGEIVGLQAWEQEGLHVFWNKERRVDEGLRDIMSHSHFLMIHGDYYEQINAQGYRMVKPFFRIKHDHKDIPAYALPNDFYMKDSHPNKECTAISDLIGRCYQDLHPSPDTVRSWSTHPVFDQNLWIWIMDKHTDSPAALGIAEFDRSVPEGSLEWIQVLPKYQGQGLGKALVLELLQRLSDRAAFSTVSGQASSCRCPQTLRLASPERLYRGCGFTGGDVWWLLRK